MTIRKALRLVLTFYASFFPAAFLISLACTGLFMYLGMSSLTVLIWFKVFTVAIIAGYISNYKHKEFLYYQNLGISKIFLWTCTLTSELLIFAMLFIISLKLI